MTNDDEELVPVFVPALSAVLLNAEDKKGDPLTFDEVVEVRDNAVCIMRTAADAKQLFETRGEDIDPENCWYDWQMLRRELERKPDLDPGPKVNQIKSSDPAYQQTILDAQATLDQFRGMLPRDGTSRLDAMVKTTITEGEHRVFMWLSNVRMQGTGFVAEFFEISDAFKNYQVGDSLEISQGDTLDWMVNEEGDLHGGFSIRYYRSTLPEEEHADYDEYIGVVRYL